MRAHNIVCLHTMVGSLAGTDSLFKRDGYGGVESHFGIGHDGTIYQWQDTAYQADANLNGNPEVISIETADTGTGFGSWSGSDVPAWTAAQLNAIVRLVAWICDVHNIPRTLIPDTKPGRRGIGYHRMGCVHGPDYRPKGWPYDAWLVSGGTKWSTVIGKVCPGDRRIRQLVDVVIPRLNEGDDMTPAEVEAAVISALRKSQTAMSPSAEQYLKDSTKNPDARLTHPQRHLLELTWAAAHSAAARVAALEPLVAKLVAGEANDLTADQVRALLAEAVIKVDVQVRDDTEPEPPA
jgi:hypothetical protein